MEVGGVFVGMGEGGGCVAAAGGLSIAVADGCIGVGVGAGVEDSGEATKVETATLRVGPSRVGVSGGGRWAALRGKGSRGKRSQAAKKPDRRAVKIIKRPTPLLNQSLFDLIPSLLREKVWSSAPAPHLSTAVSQFLTWASLLGRRRPVAWSDQGE